MFKILCLSFFFLFSSLASAAPQKDLWPYWQTYESKSTDTVDYKPYQDFLTKYVTTDANGVNQVAYSKVSAADKHQLNSYIDYLTYLKVSSYNRNEQLAYWVNLYNAMTIATVLGSMPVKSILDIKSGLFTAGPWEKKTIEVEGKQLSLNDIEHRIVRPIWNDPRTHFALNCASYSCPNLQKSAYTGKQINTMLNTATQQYINDSRGVSIDASNKLILSQIFEWYSTDFGKNDAEVLQFISKYTNPELKQKLAIHNKIDSYAYNWSLNGK